MRSATKIIFLSLGILFLASCKDKTSSGEPKLQKVGEDYYSTIIQHRKDMNNYFLSADSPLADSLRNSFTGLKYYDIDTNYRVIALFAEINNGPIFKMQATGNLADTYKTMGVLHFILNGSPYTLEVYRNETYATEGREVYFIPFYDLTNGKETYGGGRYLDISSLKGEHILLDFNNAYNPYCVFNHEYSCPIPPLKNSLKTEIRAGERM